MLLYLLYNLLTLTAENLCWTPWDPPLDLPLRKLSFGAKKTFPGPPTSIRGRVFVPENIPIPTKNHPHQKSSPPKIITLPTKQVRTPHPPPRTIPPHQAPVGGCNGHSTPLQGPMGHFSSTPHDFCR